MYQLQSSITAGTYYGDGSNLTGVSLHALEEIAGVCDGSTRTCPLEHLLFQMLQQDKQLTTRNSSRCVADGTQITYQPPSGCIGVEVTWTFFNAWSNAGHGIQHFSMLVDGTEIQWGRKKYIWSIHERLNNFRFYFRIKE